MMSMSWIRVSKLNRPFVHGAAAYSACASAPYVHSRIRRSLSTVAPHGEQSGFGTYVTEYTLDGSFAAADSVSFFDMSLAKSRARRILVGTQLDVAKRDELLGALRMHLKRVSA